LASTQRRQQLPLHRERADGPGLPEKLTRASRDITNADFEKLKKHFSDAEIVDLHLLVGLANLTNRFTDPLGLEAEFPEEKV
jgi:alkylhydroperoxidase family enzyme